MPIVIRGPLSFIRSRVLALSATIKRRKYSGWLPFQSDETWLYITHPERSIEGVCPVCQGFEAREEFIGSEIPGTFPDKEQTDPLHQVLPHVHLNRPELRGQCRCELLWLNPREVLVERLNREMIDAVTAGLVIV